MSASHVIHERWVGGLLALLLVLGVLLPATAAHAEQPTYSVEQACPEPAPDAGFTDVGGVHADAINCLVRFAIATGKTATNFGAADPVTRGQTASFVMRLYELLDEVTVPERNVDAFVDVAGTTHAANIERLANFDPPVLEGFGDETYGPGLDITRAQFASVAMRLLDQIADQADGLDPLPSVTSQAFDDVPPSNVHADNINRLAEAQILLGVTADRFDPGAPINRAQTATIVARLLGGLADAGIADLQGVTVTGVVHDATDAAPGQIGPRLDGVTIAVDRGPIREVTTDAQGAFRLTLLGNVNYTLTINEDNYLPYQQTVRGSDGDIDFPLYRTGTVPETSTATTTSPSQVEAVSGFWRIPIVTNGTIRAPQDATQIVLQRPDGVVIQLGAAGTDASLWSRTGTCASDRTGGQVGDHVVYYQFGSQWHDLTARFGSEGQLTHVNGQRYTDCSL